MSNASPRSASSAQEASDDRRGERLMPVSHARVNSPGPGRQAGPRPPCGKKAISWRRDLVILTRLAEVERRHLAGESNVAIAAALGLGEVSIRRDLERLALL